jgi:competence protein ComEC
MAPEGQTRAKAWVVDARMRAGLIWPVGLTERAHWLRGLVSQWALAEVAPGRLVPWLPVAFGIVGYFTADREPAWWAASTAAIVAVAIAFAARRRVIGFPLALGVAAMALGFAVATVQTMRIANPVLQTTISTISLSGFVEIREERERSDRVVIRVQRIVARRGVELPDRVRIIMPGLVPGIHVLVQGSKAWMAGPSPAVTKSFNTF